MPELPEVETIRSYLVERIIGQAVTALVHLDNRMVKDGSTDFVALEALIAGQRVVDVKRRGKFLYVLFSDGGHLVIHLGMSGKLVIVDKNDPWPIHTHLVIKLTHDILRLTDPRRFGRIGWLGPGEEIGQGLGMEPLSLDFTPEYLFRQLIRRNAPIKSLLLDQRIVAGLGNIYVDEALWDSQIHPLEPGRQLSYSRVTRLVESTQSVLRVSLDNRGTTFSDYVDALGHRGNNQNYLKAYGRKGQPCYRCHTPLEVIGIQARSSHFCSNCQQLTKGD